MMKPTVFPLLFIAAVLLLATSCGEDCLTGEGNRTRDYRSPGNFNKMQSTLTGRIIINLNSDLESDEIIIEAQENLFEVLETTVEDSTLKIGVNDFECLREHKDIVITLEIKSLNEITLFDLGRVETSNLITTDDFTVTVNGNAKADLLLNVKTLRTVMNGSGEITYRGEAQTHNISHNGPGSVRGYEMPVQRVNVTVNDFGNSYVRAVQSIDATFNGDGNVFYTGSPAISSSGEGNGEVRKERF